VHTSTSRRRSCVSEFSIVLDQQSRFTVGTHTVEAQSGQSIIVRPRAAQKFVNAGEGRLRQIDIHPSGAFVTG